MAYARSTRFSMTKNTSKGNKNKISITPKRTTRTKPTIKVTKKK